MSVLAVIDFTQLAAFPADWLLRGFEVTGGAAVAVPGVPGLYTIVGVAPDARALFDYTTTPGVTTLEHGYLALPPRTAPSIPARNGIVEVVFDNPIPLARDSQDELTVLIAVGLRSAENLTTWVGAAVRAHWDGSVWDIPLELARAIPLEEGLSLSDTVLPDEETTALTFWRDINSIRAEVRGDKLDYSFNGSLNGSLPLGAAGIAGTDYPVVFVQVYSVTGGVRTTYAVVREFRHTVLEPNFYGRGMEFPIPDDVMAFPEGGFTKPLPVDDLVGKGFIKQLSSLRYEVIADAIVEIVTHEGAEPFAVHLHAGTILVATDTTTQPRRVFRWLTPSREAFQARRPT